MTQVPNLHVLIVKFLGATNSRGARVKITSERFEDSITISYDYSLNGTLDIATNYLTNKGFTIIGQAEGKDHYYIISSTFEPLKP